MGLAEKRAVKEFQEGQYPNLKSAIDTACGFDVPIKVEWETLSEDGMSHLFSDAIAKIYFQPVIDGFKEICQDDMGKEALQGALKEVVFRNSGSHSNPNAAIHFEGGVLTVDHKPFSNIDDVSDRTKHLVSLLEKNL